MVLEDLMLFAEFSGWRVYGCFGREAGIYTPLVYGFGLFMYSMFIVICDYEDTNLSHLDCPYADLMWHR